MLEEIYFEGKNAEVCMYVYYSRKKYDYYIYIHGFL